ncbi:hypothetical protein BS47DRAFT_1360255 [Hydnum rufescens UP504]|uniref:Uncharacterized protein n=1 Tax=Hydnum rufescens UP504 TaxID=1448309 RepID=A0A9P6B2U0_9AGAM|nr:hypothetical protein BS47DRAFT_1360255 [Hydnum rufescens UP504]
MFSNSALFIQLPSSLFLLLYLLITDWHMLNPGDWGDDGWMPQCVLGVYSASELIELGFCDAKTLQKAPEGFRRHEAYASKAQNKDHAYFGSQASRPSQVSEPILSFPDATHTKVINPIHYHNPPSSQSQEYMGALVANMLQSQHLVINAINYGLGSGYQYSPMYDFATIPSSGYAIAPIKGQNIFANCNIHTQKNTYARASQMVKKGLPDDNYFSMPYTQASPEAPWPTDEEAAYAANPMGYHQELPIEGSEWHYMDNPAQEDPTPGYKYNYQ